MQDQAQDLATVRLVISEELGLLKQKIKMQMVIPMVTVILHDKQWSNMEYLKQLFSRFYYRNHQKECKRVDGWQTNVATYAFCNPSL